MSYMLHHQDRPGVPEMVGGKEGGKEGEMGRSIYIER